VWEDFLLAHADRLIEYGDLLSGHWEHANGFRPEIRDQLDASLGAGLESFLIQRCPAPHVVAKTPRVQNLEHFFRFFPRSKLLLLVRDGRSIIESGVRSFGWHREAALHSVAEAAGQVRTFLERDDLPSEQVRLLRYEELFEDTEAQVRDLLEFLGLDEESYPFEEACNLPVRGSSDLARADRKALHWNPVERSESFDPLSRFSAWSVARHYRYDRVAGPAMQALGYAAGANGKDGPTLKLMNALLDLGWRLKSLIRPLYRKLFPG
jgi:hypothetical protein